MEYLNAPTPYALCSIFLPVFVSTDSIVVSVVAITLGLIAIVKGVKLMVK
jgi:hypothetical protein